MWYTYTHIHAYTCIYIQISDRQDVFNRLLEIATGTSKSDCSLISMSKEASKQATDGAARLVKYV